MRPGLVAVGAGAAVVVAVALFVVTRDTDHDEFDRAAVEAAVLDHYHTDELTPEAVALVDLYEEWCTETSVEVIQYATAVEIDQRGAEAAAETVLIWGAGCPAKADEVVAGIMGLAP
jgi:hypothetical protein